MDHNIKINHELLPAHRQFNQQQSDILELLMNGYSYKFIATEKKISLASVRQYANRLYKKLSVNNRTEAAARYGKIADNKSYQSNLVI